MGSDVDDCRHLAASSRTAMPFVARGASLTIRWLAAMFCCSVLLRCSASRLFQRAVQLRCSGWFFSAARFTFTQYAALLYVGRDATRRRSFLLFSRPELLHSADSKLRAKG